jgi:hypothetical protein
MKLDEELGDVDPTAIHKIGHELGECTKMI